MSEVPSDSELSSGIDYDYAEEYDTERHISGYLVDDSIRGEWRLRQNVFYAVCASKANSKEKPLPESSSGFMVGMYGCCVAC